MRTRLFAVCLGLAASFALASTKDLSAGEQGWGTIKGQIVFEGDQLPERKEIDVTQDKAHCASKGPLYREDWVINPKNKGVKWVHVWLIPVPNSGVNKLPVHSSLQAVPKKVEELDQPCCQFVPHAIAIRQGQTVLAKNSAPVAHNVNYVGIRNPGNNIALPSGKSLAIANLVVDKVPVKVSCNIHPWMNAYIRVLDHPYFAITDENGNFEIKSVPAGKCNLVVWQESVGYRGGVPGRTGQTITIQKDKPTDLGKLGLKASYEEDK